MENHFSSISGGGRSEPALQRAAGTCPGKARAVRAQRRNRLLSVGFPWRPLCLRRPLCLLRPMLPTQPTETFQQGVQQYPVCPPKANVLSGTHSMLQLVQSHWMNLLFPQGCEQSAGFRPARPCAWTPAAISSYAPSPMSTSFLPSPVLQLLLIKLSFSLSLIFFLSAYTSWDLQVPNNPNVV